MPSVSGSSSGREGKSGFNPNSDGVRRFSLQSCAKTGDLASKQEPVLILLAEDNPADAGLVRKALEEHGVEGELIVISDGEKAIQFIEGLEASDECPDLAIIDLNLPKKPGRAVLASIRFNARCGHVPVVVLSSSDAQQDRADVLRFGATQYVRKPSRLEEFLSLGAIFKASITVPPA